MPQKQQLLLADEEEETADDDDRSSSSGMLSDYRSQHAYGAKGHLICTAVCYALADAFLLEEEEGEAILVPQGITAQRIDGIMRACHAFFVREGLTQPLMLLEMQRWFPMRPHPRRRVFEVAGLITGGPVVQTTEPSPSQTKEERKKKEPGLVLLPLDELIACMHQEEEQATDPQKRRSRIALIATCRGHTRLFLCDPRPQAQPGVWLFDPQETRLRRIDARAAAHVRRSALLLPRGSASSSLRLQEEEEKEEYAGLFLSLWAP